MLRTYYTCPSTSLVRLICFVLCCCLLLAPPAVRPQRSASAAPARAFSGRASARPVQSKMVAVGSVAKAQGAAGAFSALATTQGQANNGSNGNNGNGQNGGSI